MRRKSIVSPALTLGPVGRSVQDGNGCKWELTSKIAGQSLECQWIASKEKYDN